MTGTVALHYDPWAAQTGQRPAGRNPLALYRYAVWYKANPRDADYLRALVAGRHPDAEWVEVGPEADWEARVAAADRVLLLYPDAIGLGFSRIEARLAGAVRPGCAIDVLNGRQREFHWDSAAKGALRRRRFLEWTMLPELLFLPAFLVATPILWTIDLLRGRR